ncbi:MAG: threonylcarbamoyl-AMP synthase [Desulfobulbaceae bacterium]|nr:MAG: threonylcarbamoyl-AMP synthase [Desulfobulbaceae bacterium]
MTRREKSRCSVITEGQDDYSSIAAAVIISGGIAAIPTETSYGLAVDPFNVESLERLFEIKRRPAQKPILVLIDEVDRLSRLVREIPDSFWPLMERFWPGPLTLIFPAKPDLPSLLTAGTDTIGVRISSNRAAAEICRQAGGMITATSANVSGEQPAWSVEELISSFSSSIELIVDGGHLDQVPPSTVLRSEGNELVLVRSGRIALDDINAR